MLLGCSLSTLMTCVTASKSSHSLHGVILTFKTYIGYYKVKRSTALNEESWLIEYLCMCAVQNAISVTIMVQQGCLQIALFSIFVNMMQGLITLYDVFNISSMHKLEPGCSRKGYFSY